MARRLIKVYRVTFSAASDEERMQLLMDFSRVAAQRLADRLNQIDPASDAQIKEVEKWNY